MVKKRVRKRTKQYDDDDAEYYVRVWRSEIGREEYEELIPCDDLDEAMNTLKDKTKELNADPDTDRPVTVSVEDAETGEEKEFLLVGDTGIHGSAMDQELIKAENQKRRAELENPKRRKTQRTVGDDVSEALDGLAPDILRQGAISMVRDYYPPGKDRKEAIEKIENTTDAPNPGVARMVIGNMVRSIYSKVHNGEPLEGDEEEEYLSDPREWLMETFEI